MLKCNQEKAELLKTLVSELEAKRNGLLSTISKFNDSCTAELSELQKQMNDVSVNLLLVEGSGDAKAVKELETQQEKIKKQIRELSEKSKRYDCVKTGTLLYGDFEKLKKCARDCRAERRKNAEAISRSIQENEAAIKELQADIAKLYNQRQALHSNYEADCVAPISAYMPGGDGLNTYIPNSTDYTLSQQINHMLFAE